MIKTSSRVSCNERNENVEWLVEERKQRVMQSAVKKKQQYILPFSKSVSICASVEMKMAFIGVWLFSCIQKFISRLYEYSALSEGCHHDL